ncbi:MAG: RNA pseudouridine synthase [Gammaproteobacteria bacterium RBG_16_57_12]|nr:MAG: RNA pseudouridine synthase [Gammaproteobacteria bacterium RBG_16_57_12]
MTHVIRLQAIVPEELSGKRLDQVLATLFGDYSRSRLQHWVREGRVTVDGQLLQSKDKVFAGARLELEAMPEAEVEWQPEAISLAIVYEDADLLVINKTAGMVVHPATGNWQGTLLNALLHHAPQLAQVPRAGIVHRLDKDTTGLLVIAKTLTAQTALVTQLQARAFLREYDAVVTGVMTAGGTVTAPIGRHPVDRKRMAVTPNGKPAVSHYRVVKRYRGHTHIKVWLETGRTHQIRVHMAHIRFPLVGDVVYGGRLKLPAGCSETLRETLRGFRRQALHATRLGLAHPLDGEILQWEAPLPDDLRSLLKALQDDLTSQDDEPQ